MWEDTKWFFDNWNIFGAIAFGGIVLAAVLVGGFTTQSVLVALTALYAFFTFNQMRESKFNPRPASPLSVRPHFEIGESGSVELGVKNFGEGPALNFRLNACLVDAGETLDTMVVSTKERNLHLESGKFLSLSAG